MRAGGVARQGYGKQLDVAAAPCSACGQEGPGSGTPLALAVLALAVQLRGPPDTLHQATPQGHPEGLG